MFGNSIDAMTSTIITYMVFVECGKGIATMKISTAIPGRTSSTAIPAVTVRIDAAAMVIRHFCFVLFYFLVPSE